MCPTFSASSSANKEKHHPKSMWLKSALLLPERLNTKNNLISNTLPNSKTISLYICKSPENTAYYWSSPNLDSFSLMKSPPSNPSPEAESVKIPFFVEPRIQRLMDSLPLTKMEVLFPLTLTPILWYPILSILAPIFLIMSMLPLDLLLDIVSQELIRCFYSNSTLPWLVITTLKPLR